MKSPDTSLENRLSFIVSGLKDGNIGFAMTQDIAKQLVEDEKDAHVVKLLFDEIIKLSRQNLAMSCPFLHQNNKFRV